MSTEMIFIVGNSRSGTTMLGRVLGNHPLVFTFHELHFFEELWVPDGKKVGLERKEACRLIANLMSVQRTGYLEKREIDRYRDEALAYVNGLDKELLLPSRLFSGFLRYETALHGKKIACDQTPRNLFYAQEILELYPGAKIINLTRDPRDVLLSQKNKWKRRNLEDAHFTGREVMRLMINYHPYTTSKLWNSAVKFASRFNNPKRFYSLKFEDLLENPHREIGSICRFLEIEYSPEMLDIPHIASSFQKDDLDRKGINRSPLHRWKKGQLSDEEIYICQRINCELLRAWNYEIKEDVAVNRLKVLYYYLNLPLKLVLSLIVNLRRSRNIIASVKRRLYAA